jgi:hypothetical protein
VGVLKNILVGVYQNKRNQKVTTSQDDGFVEEVENIWLGVQKRGKIKKVTGSKRSETAP